MDVVVVWQEAGRPHLDTTVFKLLYFTGKWLEQTPKERARHTFNDVLGRVAMGDAVKEKEEEVVVAVGDNEDEVDRSHHQSQDERPASEHRGTTPSEEPPAVSLFLNHIKAKPIVLDRDQECPSLMDRCWYHVRNSGRDEAKLAFMYKLGTHMFVWSISAGGRVKLECLADGPEEFFHRDPKVVTIPSSTTDSSERTKRGLAQHPEVAPGSVMEARRVHAAPPKKRRGVQTLAADDDANLLPLAPELKGKERADDDAMVLLGDDDDEHGDYGLEAHGGADPMQADDNGRGDDAASTSETERFKVCVDAQVALMRQQLGKGQRRYISTGRYELHQHAAALQQQVRTMEKQVQQLGSINGSCGDREIAQVRTEMASLKDTVRSDLKKAFSAVVVAAGVQHTAREQHGAQIGGLEHRVGELERAISGLGGVLSAVGR